MPQKTWQCDDVRPVPGLIEVNAEIPVPAAGELLIRIHAAGVTPTELQWYPTTHTKSGENRQHAIPGHEFSGIIAAMGPGAGLNLEVGQAVFGMNDWFANGATAEYCCASHSAVAPKPTKLTHAEAATIPISGLTAWQGLFDRANLQSGESVLIHGGSGAVGLLAIQLAAWRGAHVVTTASAQHRDFLILLGAHQVIDYRTEKFEDLAPRVDVVFDTVGGAILERSWDILGPSQRMVTIATSSEVTDDERIKKAFFIVEPNQAQLREISGLLDAGLLRPKVNTVLPFEQAAVAYSSPGIFKRDCGKTVITPR